MIGFVSGIDEDIGVEEYLSGIRRPRRELLVEVVEEKAIQPYTRLSAIF